MDGLEGLEWRVEVTVSARYPFEPLVFRVLGKPGAPPVEHPNVDPATGILCNFRADCQWSAAFNIRLIFTAFQSFFSSPAVEEPLNPDAARLFREDRAQWAARMRSSGVPQGALLAECGARHDAHACVEALRGASVAGGGAGALVASCSELRPLLGSHAQALADAGLLAALLDALGDPRATDPRACQAVASTISAMLRCGGVFKGAVRESCCGGAGGGGGGAGAAAAAAGSPCLPAAMLRVLVAHRADAGARGAACEALAELAFVEADGAHYGEQSVEALPVLIGALHDFVEPPLAMQCPEVEFASAALGYIMKMDPAAALAGARMLCPVLDEACGQGRWRRCSTVLHHLDAAALRFPASEAAEEVATGYVRPLLHVLAEVNVFEFPGAREKWSLSVATSLARLLCGVGGALKDARVAICAECGAEGRLRAALAGLPAIAPHNPGTLQSAISRWHTRARLSAVLTALPLEVAPPALEPFPHWQPPPPPQPLHRFVVLAPPAPEEVQQRMGSCQACWLRVPREPCPREPPHNAPAEHVCFICYVGPGEDGGGPFTLLPCGHVIHASCLFGWAVFNTRDARRGMGGGGAGHLNCYCGTPLPLRRIEPDETPAEGEMVVQTPVEGP